MLRHAGVIAMEVRGDRVTWWFDPSANWRSTIKLISQLHDIDRDELLRLMKHVAVEHFRAVNTETALLSFAKRKRGNEAAG